MKYPIELEFTDICGLKCTSCCNQMLPDKGFLKEKDFDLILRYLVKNSASILYINISGIGDVFLHPDVNIFLTKMIHAFNGEKPPILFPTKGQSINSKHIELLKCLQTEGFQINISVGIYSLNKERYNVLSGGHNLEDVFEFMKQLRKEELPFSLELLQTTYNQKEIFYAQKIALIFGCGFDVQSYHNFSGKLELNSPEMQDNICSFDDQDYRLKGAYCSYIPFIDSKGNIYTCNISGKDTKHFLGNLETIFSEFPKYENLVSYIQKDFLNKEKCFNCSIYQHYERQTSVGNSSISTM